MAVSVQSAWIDAEHVIFDAIVAHMQDVRGASAYLGDLPPGLVDCWALTTGGGAADQTWGGCFGTLIVDGEITGRWQDREDAQRFGGRLFELLQANKNFNQIRNVQWFRFAGGGMPRVFNDTFIPANQPTTSQKAYKCTSFMAAFQMVYNTSKEY